MIGPGGDDDGDGDDGVSPRSKRVPLPLRRLPADRLRKLYSALEELEVAGLQHLQDVGALRAAIAEKAGLSKELLPLEAFTTEYAAMSLWAWTPSRWRAALAQHGAPSCIAAPAAAGDGAAADPGGPDTEVVAKAKAALRRKGWLVDDDGSVRQAKPPAEKEEAAPPEEPSPSELADTNEGGGDGGGQEEQAELSPEERLEAAAEELDCLCLASIVELRSFKAPPRLSQNVVRIVGCLLGRGDESTEWQVATKMMAVPCDFMTALRDFDAKGVPDSTWDSVEKMLSLPGMTKENVKRTSVAACSLFQWCSNIFVFSGRSLPQPPPQAEREEPAEDPEVTKKAERLTVWWRAMLEAGQELQEMALQADSMPTSKGDGLGVLFGNPGCLDGGPSKAPRKPKDISVGKPTGCSQQPRASSVVMVHVGGDGCGMGAAAWRRLLSDHGLGEAADGGPLDLPAQSAGVDFGVHFAETRAGKLVPRATFAGSTEHLGPARGLGCAPVDLLEGSSGDEGGTFYHGYWNRARAEAITEGTRRQMEMCDFCPYLMMTHSGGDDGADSGLACKVLEDLKSSIGGKKLLVWSLCCVASGETASAASKVNAALSIHHGLREHTDFCTMVDQESLMRVASAKVNGLGLASPCLGECWQLTSGVVAAWTSPLSLGKWVAASVGTRRLSPLGLTTNLVPYPGLHFCGPSYSPLTPAEMAQFDTSTNSSTVQHALAAGRLSNGVAGKKLCSALLCRGIEQTEAWSEVNEAKCRAGAESVDWAPIGCAVGSHGARAGHVGPSAEAVALQNCGGFGNLFESWLSGFGELGDSERSTYFEVGPFNQGCFDEAKEAVEGMVQTYKEVCEDTKEEEEDECDEF